MDGTQRTRYHPRGSNQSYFPPDEMSGDNSLPNSLIRSLRAKLPRLPTRDSTYSSGSSTSYVSEAEYRRHSRSHSASTGSGSRPSSGIGTPPPVYRSRVSVCASETDPCETGDEEACVLKGDGGWDAGDELDVYSGVKWRYANQACNLFRIATEESHHSTLGDKRAADLTRQTYLHGTTYALRGLPSDLSAAEAKDVWLSLPVEIRNLAATHQTLIRETRNSSKAIDMTSENSYPSILHRVVATCIIQIFLLIQFFAPYLQTLISSLASFERRHHLSEKAFAAAVKLAEKGMRIAEAFCGLDDGRVGIAVGDAAVYWIQGFAGGIRQGVGEGLVVIGVNNDRR